LRNSSFQGRNAVPRRIARTRLEQTGRTCCLLDFEFYKSWQDSWNRDCSSRSFFLCDSQLNSIKEHSNQSAFAEQHRVCSTSGTLLPAGSRQDSLLLRVVDASNQLLASESNKPSNSLLLPNLAVEHLKIRSRFKSKSCRNNEFLLELGTKLLSLWRKEAPSRQVHLEGSWKG